MKSLRSLLALVGSVCCLQVAHAQFTNSSIQTDGGNHSNVTCYVNVSTTQYVSTSSTPVSSNPTLPGTVTAGSNAEWVVSNSISGSTTQYTSGTNFTACAHLADIKGKNFNGGSVPLNYYSSVLVSTSGTVKLSTSGTTPGPCEIYKNGTLIHNPTGGVTNYPITVVNGDLLWIKVTPANDNTNGPALTVWNF